MADNKTNPPYNVFAEIVSPKKSHTHRGPKRTSANENRASCAVGRAFEPKVYKTRPAPT